MARYVEYRQSNHRTERTVASLRKQYQSMLNHSKPTGDPDCPSHIRRAKRLARDIEEECFIETLDDPVEEFSSQPQPTVNDPPGPAARSTMPPPLSYDTNTNESETFQAPFTSTTGSGDTVNRGYYRNTDGVMEGRIVIRFRDGYR